MKKTELQNMRKLKLPEVIKEKENLEVELVKEIARLASQGKKSSKSLREIKRKIAWAETVISQLLAQTLTASEVEND